MYPDRARSSAHMSFAAHVACPERLHAYLLGRNASPSVALRAEETSKREVVEVNGRSVVVALLVASLVGVGLFAQKVTVLPVVPLLVLAPTHYLSGNGASQEAVLGTDKGEQKTQFQGAIELQVWASGTEITRIALSGLNLVSKGVETGNGPSGTLGLMLGPSSVQLTYDPRTGAVSGELEMILHYELINRLRGFQKQECRGECDLFAPYTQRMVGKLSARFAKPLTPLREGRVDLTGEVSFDLKAEDVTLVKSAKYTFNWGVNWTLYRPAVVLKIQPVFVGTGPSDPNATGKNFNTLMNYARTLWNKCGTVRCVVFSVNSPIYVNNNAYKVLDNEAEATAFMAEVNVPDAVEVFIAERMATSLTCSWGGGACWSSGTASAQVVSSDQQLAVPCSCPCPSYCPCGPCQCGVVNYYHLAHELGHALNLAHPGPPGSLAASSATSNLEPSGFCCDNPSLQSAQNCRNAGNPLLTFGLSLCKGSPEIMD